MPYQPPSLTALLCPRAGGAADQSRRRFEELTGRTPSHSLETTSWVAQVLVPPTTAVDDGGPVAVVIHGETYDGRRDPARAVASDWSRRGHPVAADLVGSYALVVADRTRDQLSVVTDRPGSRRLFCSTLDGATLVSSTLAPHRAQRFAPDPIGVASFLINGRAYGGRTVLDGVRLLRQASIHRLTADGLASTPYWELHFEPSGASEDELRAELSDRLAAAVDRCLFDRPTPFLALSGGKDSRGIAGELRRSAAAEDVECFSFVRGDPRPGCDEQVAAEIAELLGYRHRLVQTYDGDLPGLVHENARLGEGNTNLVHEVAGCKALADRFDAVDRPVVLTGDMALGLYDVALPGPQDVLNSLSIHGLDAAPHLAGLLPGRTYDDMAEGVEADRNAIWARCSQIGDLHDAAYYLYIDQRLPHVILPWREAVAGQFSPVRRPLIDNDVLDLVSVLPTDLRRGKRLYCSTMEARHPQLFRIPRATDQNFRIDLPTEVARHAIAVRHLIDGRSSVVDDLVPPDVVHQLLATALRPAREPWRAHGLRVARRLVPAPVRARVRSRFPPSSVPHVTPAMLLVRLLVLRTALPS